MPPPSAEAAAPRVGARAFLGLDRVDVAWLLALVVVSFLLRIAGPVFPNALGGGGSGPPVVAWGLGYPYNSTSGEELVPVGPGGADQAHKGFVFDEVYFPVDAAKDLHQPAISYYDPEPPLAKLLMAPPIAALGFGGWSWRLTCAIAGSLLVGVVYMLARRLRSGRFFAVAAATFVSLDGLAFVESRTGVIDIIAVFFVALFYYAFILHWQARTRTQWRSTLYLMAVVAGLAFGAKLTALAPLVVAVALILARALEPRALRLLPGLRGIGGARAGEAVMWRDAAGGRALLHYGAALLLAGSVFCACYSRYLTIEHPDVFRFTACVDPRPPDVTGGPEGTADHQQVPVLHLGGVSLPDVPTAIANVYGQLRNSLSYHSNECRGHPYASRWYTWPVMAHPVLFYADYTDHTAGGAVETSWITNMGNPAVWWPAMPALLVCCVLMTRGPTLWRLVPVAVIAAGLLLMAAAFHAAEQSDTVRVHPGGTFIAGFALVAAGCALAVLSAVLSRRFVPAFIVLGYLVAWMMWVPGNEPRVLFFYHMLGALPFMALGLAYVLDRMRDVRIGTLRGHAVTLAPVAPAAVAVVVATFAFFFPVWTGLPQTAADHAMRIWLPGW